METDKVWDDESITYLRDITRNNKFDFEKISIIMNEYYKSNNKNYLITSDICREVFTNDYYSTDKYKPIEKADEVSHNYDNLTYHELLQIIETNDQRNKQRQEEVFARVLESLRVDDSNSNIMTEEISSVILQYQTNKKLRELEKQELINKQKERNERKYYELEREKLKKRFIENPIDEYEQSMTANSKSILDSDMYKEIDIDFGFNVDHINMKEVFESKEFDRILDEVERDLALLAPDKTDSDLSSDLQDVFRILDAAASEAKPIIPVINYTFNYQTNSNLQIDSNSNVDSTVNANDKVLVDNFKNEMDVNYDNIDNKSIISNLEPNKSKVKSRLINQPIDNNTDSNSDEDEDDIDNWRKYRTIKKTELISNITISPTIKSNSTKTVIWGENENHSIDYIKLLKQKKKQIVIDVNDIVVTELSQQDDINENEFENDDNENVENEDIVNPIDDNIEYISDLGNDNKIEEISTNVINKLIDDSPWDNLISNPIIIEEIDLPVTISKMSGSLMRKKNK